MYFDYFWCRYDDHGDEDDSDDYNIDHGDEDDGDDDNLADDEDEKNHDNTSYNGNNDDG